MTKAKDEREGVVKNADDMLRVLNWLNQMWKLSLIALASEPDPFFSECTVENLFIVVLFAPISLYFINVGEKPFVIWQG